MQCCWVASTAKSVCAIQLEVRSGVMGPSGVLHYDIYHTPYLGYRLDVMAPDLQRPRGRFCMAYPTLVATEACPHGNVMVYAH